jgi:hypothetical protein
MMSDAEDVQAMGIAAKLILGVLVLFSVGFVAACLESALANWEDESDDPR